MPTSSRGVCKIEGGPEGDEAEGTGVRAIEERFGSYVDEHPAVFRFEKWLQIYAGKHPSTFYGLYRLARKDQKRVVTPDTQLVIEGFPRSANTFARVAFNRAQSERVRIAHGLHVPAQVIRASRWQIPTLVLIRAPKDAVISFAIRDPISVDQALRSYLSFYETVEEYRDAYVLGLFEEVIEDFGEVIRRINDRFGTTFSPFSHDEPNVDGVFARIEKNAKKRFGERSLENKVSRPFASREKLKREVGYELENPKRRDLISRAETVYDRLTGKQAQDH
ncbi:MAG TPA: hypothetical protein VK902_08775 [Rubrobacter sp.]|nr:hypothetical protein [Rubrobacter sp.]